MKCYEYTLTFEDTSEFMLKRSCCCIKGKKKGEERKIKKFIKEPDSSQVKIKFSRNGAR